ncbi:cation-translocating P-type ATPase, partial [Anaerolineae bacterium CFX7]|nr:cation-translocating P-type ATPase [Anaerolineae bacterium CFX7]
LPGGYLAGANGTMAYAQTMAFTTLVFFQLFNAFNARSDELSAFAGFFTNRWLWLALGVSLLLQVAVIYVPFLQTAFSTVPLAPTDWAICIAVGSTVLWLREIVKVFQRRRAKR